MPCYIDPETGKQVGAGWWPGDSVEPTQMDRIEALLAAILEAVQPDEDEDEHEAGDGMGELMLDGSRLE